MESVWKINRTESIKEAASVWGCLDLWDKNSRNPERLRHISQKQITGIVSWHFIHFSVVFLVYSMGFSAYFNPVFISARFFSINLVAFNKRYSRTVFPVFQLLPSVLRETGGSRCWAWSIHSHGPGVQIPEEQKSPFQSIERHESGANHVAGCVSRGPLQYVFPFVGHRMNEKQ